MRSRTEILKQFKYLEEVFGGPTDFYHIKDRDTVLLEVLLDIRDLLQRKEITRSDETTKLIK